MFVPGTKEPDESQRASQTNLPAQLTPLVGREQEVEESVPPAIRGDTPHDAYRSGRIGKTRLGIRGRGMADERRRCLLESLAPIREPELVIPTIARMLGLRELGRSPSQSVWESSEREGTAAVPGQLRAGSRSRAAGGRALGRLSPSEGAGDQREVLHLSCERVFPVPPLRLPDVEQLPEDIRASRVWGRSVLRSAGQDGEARLPAHRGERPRGGRDLRSPRRDAACHRARGGPPKLISPRAILERLRRRLRLLKGGRGTRRFARRLRDAIGWSYDLLGGKSGRSSAGSRSSRAAARRSG